jgi:DNA-binding FadR family transcriptional regulator
MSPLASPQRTPLVDQVIAQLRGQITSGEWPVGSRIPTEPELVELLGVARNTIREAVRALAHSGLLDIRQGAGTFVRTTSELAAVMRRRYGDSSQRDLRELRRALEVEASRLAARRRTPADLEALDAALSRREAAWESREVDAFIEADSAFHHAVVTASGNTALADLFADLGEVVRDVLRADIGVELLPEEYVDHGRLVAAIRDQDAERAAIEAGAHLEGNPTPPSPR